MRAVVTYWQLPEDEHDFLDFLSSTGEVVAMPDHWVKTKEELEPKPVRSFIREQDPAQLLFGLRHHATQAIIKPEQKNGERWFSVSDMKSCLIGYARGRLRDKNMLGQSNLHAYWDYVDDSTMTLQIKDPEFIKWGKAVLAWIRKVTAERIECHGHQYRATERVKD